MRARHFLVALAATLLLAGCGGLLPKPAAFDVYRLPATATAPAAGPALAWDLRIDTPDSTRTLASSRIVVLPDASRVSIYQGARWSERAPLLLRNRVLAAFQEDGRIPLVSSEDDGLPADFRLAGRLAAFHAEYLEGGPAAVIQFDAWLLAESDARPIANRSFRIVEPASTTAVASVVEAFGRAGDALAAELVDWVVDAGGQARAGDN